MTRSDAVLYVLERVRPAIQADGGDLELISFDGETARVRLTGACGGCPSAHITIESGIEAALRQAGVRVRVLAVAS